MSASLACHNRVQSLCLRPAIAATPSADRVQAIYLLQTNWILDRTRTPEVTNAQTQAQERILFDLRQAL